MQIGYARVSKTQDQDTLGDLRALTPLKWQHINPYGMFTLNMAEHLPIETPAVS